MKRVNKKQKFLLFLISIFLGYYLYSYHSENRKYEILNEIFLDLDYNFEYICVNKDYVNFNDEQFKEFSLLDKPSIYSQYWLQNFFGTFYDFKNWEINKIKPQKIKYKDDDGKIQFSTILSDCSVELKEEKYENYSKMIYTNPPNISISLPILSADGNTAIMQISDHCGMLCGSGSTYLFKKIDGKWKLINKNMSWIS